MFSFCFEGLSLGEAARHFFASSIGALLLVIVPAASAVYAPSGLDERPENTTCVAPPRPVTVTGTRVEQAFPSLSFRTVPNQPNSQFLNGVIDMEQRPADNDWWYVVERAGRIHRVANDDGATGFTTVLDIASSFSGISYFEQWGINSIAFHPDFANNGQLYVLYNTRPSSSNFEAVLARFTSIDGGLSFDPATKEILLTANDSNTYHQFGDVAFGPDGYLYASLGAPAASQGQNVNDLHGSVLRLDVDAPFPFAVPADNPFAGGGGRAEIYAWGLRNPWRMSFDSQSGELWLGDVGEGLAEEINVINLGGNYGWSIAEGNSCSGGGCASVTPPVHTYSHSTGRAITGGFVYRGSAIPELFGRYVFGDSNSGEKIWALNYDGTGNVTGREVLIDSLRTTGFAADQNGELLAIDLVASKIYRLLPGTEETVLPDDFPQQLSLTGCVDAADPREPAAGLVPYTLNTPLWTDGADKRRWMALPDGTQVNLDADGDFLFPPGTVLVKEFAFNGVPVETRLLMRHPDGVWAGYSYRWRADQSDADLLQSGLTVTVAGGALWQFPSPAQCLQCHVEANNYAAGPELVQLNGEMLYPSSGVSSNQLGTLEHIGVLAEPLTATPGMLPALAAPHDTSLPVAQRARAYLHSNCSGCHRPGGTSQSDLDLRHDTPVLELNACNRLPQHGDLGVADARLISPGSPNQSLISLRMQTLERERMPPLGTNVIDVAGSALLDAWIGDADVCVEQADSDGDGVADPLDNCSAVANASQRDRDGDGFGDACDGDLNNDCTVNAIDLGLLRQQFFASGALAADLNGDDIVNAIDLAQLRAMFFQAPGPSGYAGGCAAP